MFYKIIIYVSVSGKYREVGMFGNFESLQKVVDAGVDALGGEFGRPGKNFNAPKQKKSNRQGNMCRW